MYHKERRPERQSGRQLPADNFMRSEQYAAIEWRKLKFGAWEDLCRRGCVSGFALSVWMTENSNSA
jgi:hypothetical protein